jgi:hypothetical protein
LPVSDKGFKFSSQGFTKSAEEPIFNAYLQLTKIFDLEHLTDDLASQIPGLSDVRIAELALDARDSANGRERLARYLNAQPCPHYESDPSSRDQVVRVEENGTRVRGHFVNKDFVVVNDEQ